MEGIVKMFTILLFFIIGQLLKVGTAYWIVWGLSILFWTINLICKTVQFLLKVKEEQ